MPVIREALDEAGAELAGCRCGRRHREARADRRAARRRFGGEGARLVAPPAADPRRPSARTRRVALPAAARSRAAVHLPARERRAHDAAGRPGPWRRSACSARPSTTPQARPSTRARDCSASVIRAGRRSTRSRAAATRPPSTFRSHVCRDWTSPSRASRRHCSTRVRDLAGVRARGAARRSRSLATSARSCVRSSSACEPTGAGRIAVVGGVAANSELRAALPDAALAPLELCTDNAAMIASAARYIEPVPYPEYLSLDAQCPA